MKRPLAVVGLTMLGVAFSLCKIQNSLVTALVCAFSALAFLIFMLIKKTRQTAFLPTVFFSAAAVCLLLLSFENNVYLPSQNLLSEETQIEAQITDFPFYSNSRYYCMAKIKDSKTEREYKIRLSFSTAPYYDSFQKEKVEALEVGDTVKFKGCVYKIANSKESTHESFKSRKIFLGAYPKEEIQIQKAQRKSLLYFLKSERRKIINKLLTISNTDAAGLGISLLLGDKTYVDSDIYSAFRRSGVSHLMAVSGLHLSVWIFAVMKIIEYLRLDKRKWAMLLLLFNFAVMFFASFSGSVVRAGLMMFLYLLGFVFKKDPDSLNSLGFAAAVIIIQNPYSCLNIGFLLSFVSTLAIITVCSPCISKIEDKLNFSSLSTLKRTVLLSVSTSVIISLCVSFFTFPLCIYYFSSFSTLCVLTNLLLLPVATPIIVFFGLYVVFCSVPIVSAFLEFVCVAFSKYILFFVNAVSSIDASLITISTFETKLLLLLWTLAALVFLVCFHIKNRKANIVFCVSFLVLSLSFFSLKTVYQNSVLTLTVHDVGDGLCVSAEYKGKNALLYSSLDSYHEDFLKDEFDKVDLIFLSDAQNENLSFLSEVSCGKLVSNENINLLPSSLRKIYNESTSEKLSDVEISIEGETVYINAFSLSVAISSKHGAQADIIFTNNPSYLLDIDEKSVIILSGESSSDSALSTEKFEDITVSISKGAVFCVTGENSWQYLMKNN